MDNQFTTTFIPKKPIVPQTQTAGAPVSRPVGLLSTISVILFFVTIACGVGVYFWQSMTEQNIVKLEESIAKIEKTFEPQLVTTLQKLDTRLRNGNTLLKNHTVVTPVFDLLEASTLRQIRFTKFDMSFDAEKGTLVKMSGESDGYRSIAQQSDMLGSNTYLRDTIFSNFALNQRGRVTFDVSFGIHPDFLDFEKAPMAGANNQAPTEPLNI